MLQVTTNCHYVTRSLARAWEMGRRRSAIVRVGRYRRTMQLVEVGRNEPCPCGSGRKYKKCCLAAREAAVVGTVDDLDVKAMVDLAIETDDWDAIHDHVDRAMEAFEHGAPLEHVRFRNDRIPPRDLDSAALANLCTVGWLRRAEFEIARVLDRFVLDPDIRHGLRMSVHLLRRFGAGSPIVEELGRLQVDEQVERVRRFANALSRLGLSAADVTAGWPDVFDWIEEAKPAILSFAQWFALRAEPADGTDEVWLSSIASRVADRCLDELNNVPGSDARPWLQLASISILHTVPGIGQMIALYARLQNPTPDEQAIFDALQHKLEHEDLRGKLHVIVAA